LYATGEPGPMALAAIAWARIKKVYYGNDHKATSEIGFDDEPIYRFLMKKPSSIKMKLVQIDKQDAYELYKAWKNKSNKTMY
jgi:tRNA(Arg) A34 adenosine deaminase TadA